MTFSDNRSNRLATRIAFLVAGFGIACWAPLIPYAKERLGADDKSLGLLLLCLGIGSVLAMTITGTLSARFGSRPVILLSSISLSLVLPLLAVAPTTTTLGLALLVFGASLGSLDVSMNIHAVEVEKAAETSLMSGFHALFSIGGFFGASAMTMMLSGNVHPFVAALLGSATMLVAIFVARPHFLRSKTAQGEPFFVVPRGIVLALAGLTAIMFLVEGALLDWGALLITSAKLVDVRQAGAGYLLFSVAMTLGRLTGDALTTRLGDRATVFWSGFVAIAGFVVLLVAPIVHIALFGFVLIGLGASNIVPVLFRQAGSQKVMPPNLAIGAITTTGYAGILIGPVGIGFIAQIIGLSAAFWMLAVLLVVVPLSAGAVILKKQDLK